MTSKRIAQTNQQQKSEKPQGSGILQRAAVRSDSDAGMQSTDDKQALTLSNSAFSKDFSQVPISTTKPQQFQARNPQSHPVSLIQAKLTIGEPGDRVIQGKGEMTGKSQVSSEVLRPNKTGLPDHIKTGIENISGYSMHDVRVHYNSPKPAQLQALAYTQGTDIHVAPGQEEYLPHEAWHVVQQKQGRVKPTLQMKGGVNINDDVGLEKEADVMGNNAINIPDITQVKKSIPVNESVTQSVVQTVKKKESGKEKFDRQMKEMNDLIEKTNEKIQDVHNIKARFSTDSSTTPMNPAVFFQELPTTDSLKISKNEARLANFSSMVKKFVNAQQKSNVTPEIQTALVKSTLDAAETIHISGNTSNANRKIGVQKPTVLGDYYRDNIREISIRQRVLGIEKVAKRLIQKGKIGVKPGFRKQVKINKNDTEPDIAKKVVRQLFTDNKRNHYRLSGTSSRKFARLHSAKQLRVPTNKKNIHAESAILASLRDTKAKIQEIGGTKVACLACQAYFTHLHQEELLGENTGYGWVSKSSQTQLNLLIGTINTAEEYLINLAKILESRLSSLKRYTGSAGNKKVEEADSESDVEDTDSEDEAAIITLEKSPLVMKIVKALLLTV